MKSTQFIQLRHVFFYVTLSLHTSQIFCSDTIDKPIASVLILSQLLQNDSLVSQIPNHDRTSPIQQMIYLEQLLTEQHKNTETQSCSKKKPRARSQSHSGERSKTKPATITKPTEHAKIYLAMILSSNTLMSLKPTSSYFHAKHDHSRLNIDSTSPEASDAHVLYHELIDSNHSFSSHSFSSDEEKYF